MSKPRLGRAERLLKRQVFDGARRAQLIDMAVRQATDDQPLTSAGYAKVRPLEGSMTHGLYRGLYDPNLSTVPDTGRGFAKKDSVTGLTKLKPVVKVTSRQRLGFGGPVKSLKEGTL